MATQFTDSKGQHVATRLSSGRNQGTRLEVSVSMQEFESQVWLISEEGECFNRERLVLDNSVHFVSQRPTVSEDLPMYEDWSVC